MHAPLEVQLLYAQLFAKSIHTYAPPKLKKNSIYKKILGSASFRSKTLPASALIAFQNKKKTVLLFDTPVDFSDQDNPQLADFEDWKHCHKTLLETPFSSRKKKSTFMSQVLATPLGTASQKKCDAIAGSLQKILDTTDTTSRELNVIIAETGPIDSEVKNALFTLLEQCRQCSQKATLFTLRAVIRSYASALEILYQTATKQSLEFLDEGDIAHFHSLCKIMTTVLETLEFIAPLNGHSQWVRYTASTVAILDQENPVFIKTGMQSKEGIIKVVETNEGFDTTIPQTLSLCVDWATQATALLEQQAHSLAKISHPIHSILTHAQELRDLLENQKKALPEANRMSLLETLAIWFELTHLSEWQPSEYTLQMSLEVEKSAVAPHAEVGMAYRYGLLIERALKHYQQHYSPQALKEADAAIAPLIEHLLLLWETHQYPKFGRLLASFSEYCAEHQLTVLLTPLIWALGVVIPSNLLISHMKPSVSPLFLRKLMGFGMVTKSEEDCQKEDSQWEVSLLKKEKWFNSAHFLNACAHHFKKNLLLSPLEDWEDLLQEMSGAEMQKSLLLSHLIQGSHNPYEGDILTHFIESMTLPHSQNNSRCMLLFLKFKEANRIVPEPLISCETILTEYKNTLSQACDPILIHWIPFKNKPALRHWCEAWTDALSEYLCTMAQTQDLPMLRAPMKGTLLKKYTQVLVKAMVYELPSCYRFFSQCAWLTAHEESLYSRFILSIKDSVQLLSPKVLFACEETLIKISRFGSDCDQQLAAALIAVLHGKPVSTRLMLEPVSPDKELKERLNTAPNPAELQKRFYAYFPCFPSPYQNTLISIQKHLKYGAFHEAYQETLTCLTLLQNHPELYTYDHAAFFKDLLILLEKWSPTPLSTQEPTLSSIEKSPLYFKLLALSQKPVITLSTLTHQERHLLIAVLDIAPDWAKTLDVLKLFLSVLTQLELETKRSRPEEKLHEKLKETFPRLLPKGFSYALARSSNLNGLTDTGFLTWPLSAQAAYLTLMTDSWSLFDTWITQEGLSISKPERALILQKCAAILCQNSESTQGIAKPLLPLLFNTIETLDHAILAILKSIDSLAQTAQIHAGSLERSYTSILGIVSLLKNKSSELFFARLLTQDQLDLLDSPGQDDITRLFKLRAWIHSCENTLATEIERGLGADIYKTMGCVLTTELLYCQFEKMSTYTEFLSQLAAEPFLQDHLDHAEPRLKHYLISRSLHLFENQSPLKPLKEKHKIDSQEYRAYGEVEKSTDTLDKTDPMTLAHALECAIDEDKLHIIASKLLPYAEKIFPILYPTDSLLLLNTLAEKPDQLIQTCSRCILNSEPHTTEVISMFLGNPLFLAFNPHRTTLIDQLITTLEAKPNLDYEVQQACLTVFHQNKLTLIMGAHLISREVALTAYEILTILEHLEALPSPFPTQHHHTLAEELRHETFQKLFLDLWKSTPKLFREILLLPPVTRALQTSMQYGLISPHSELESTLLSVLKQFSLVQCTLFLKQYLSPYLEEKTVESTLKRTLTAEKLTEKLLALITPNYAVFNSEDPLFSEAISTLTASDFTAGRLGPKPTKPEVSQSWLKAMLAKKYPWFSEHLAFFIKGWQTQNSVLDQKIAQLEAIEEDALMKALLNQWLQSYLKTAPPSDDKETALEITLEMGEFLCGYTGAILLIAQRLGSLCRHILSRHRNSPHTLVTQITDSHYLPFEGKITALTALIQSTKWGWANPILLSLPDSTYFTALWKNIIPPMPSVWLKDLLKKESPCEQRLISYIENELTLAKTASVIELLNINKPELIPFLARALHTAYTHTVRTETLADSDPKTSTIRHSIRALIFHSIEEKNAFVCPIVVQFINERTLQNSTAMEWIYKALLDLGHCSVRSFEPLINKKNQGALSKLIEDLTQEGFLDSEGYITSAWVPESPLFLSRFIEETQLTPYDADLFISTVNLHLEKQLSRRLGLLKMMVTHAKETLYGIKNTALGIRTVYLLPFLLNHQEAPGFQRMTDDLLQAATEVREEKTVIGFFMNTLPMKTLATLLCAPDRDHRIRESIILALLNRSIDLKQHEFFLSALLKECLKSSQGDWVSDKELQVILESILQFYVGSPVILTPILAPYKDYIKERLGCDFEAINEGRARVKELFKKVLLKEISPLELGQGLLELIHEGFTLLEVTTIAAAFDKEHSGIYTAFTELIASQPFLINAPNTLCWFFSTLKPGLKTGHVSREHVSGLGPSGMIIAALNNAGILDHDGHILVSDSSQITLSLDIATLFRSTLPKNSFFLKESETNPTYLKKESEKFFLKLSAILNSRIRTHTLSRTALTIMGRKLSEMGLLKKNWNEEMELLFELITQIKSGQTRTFTHPKWRPIFYWIFSTKEALTWFLDSLEASSLLPIMQPLYDIHTSAYLLEMGSRSLQKNALHHLLEVAVKIDSETLQQCHVFALIKNALADHAKITLKATHKAALQEALAFIQAQRSTQHELLKNLFLSQETLIDTLSKLPHCLGLE